MKSARSATNAVIAVAWPWMAQELAKRANKQFRLEINNLLTLHMNIGKEAAATEQTYRQPGWIPWIM